jgi:hypothetical protein
VEVVPPALPSPPIPVEAGSGMFDHFAKANDNEQERSEVFKTSTQKVA